MYVHIYVYVWINAHIWIYAFMAVEVCMNGYLNLVHLHIAVYYIYVCMYVSMYFCMYHYNYICIYV